ncbi:motile sperm domain-containing protein 3 isoform X1 [Tamandua tetradactyla]|uniref:motile sperm domain-containing protein 3 isoform X1 n=1 Tax=Tamandua tetradactyla TaxID=48850 RepID=UPI0040547A16
MRRGAPQDQELVGPGRGSRGAPPPTGLVVPVLVFPPDLVFRADQRSGPRQLLTLYNPTGAALRFRVLCTAPAKYTVFDAEGYVKPQSCIDIVIRHVAPSPSHYDIQDRFRIELSEEGAEGRIVGRKDIPAVLRAPAYPLELPGRPDPAAHPRPPAWTPPPTAGLCQESLVPQIPTHSWPPAPSSSSRWRALSLWPSCCSHCRTSSAASCPKSSTSPWDRSWWQPMSWASSPWCSSEPEPPVPPPVPPTLAGIGDSHCDTHTWPQYPPFPSSAFLAPAPSKNYPGICTHFPS